MLRQKLIPIFTALLITLSFSPNLQAAGSQVSIASDEKCYGPDCEWYQRLLNTLEEAEDKAYAARACMERILELTIANRETLTQSGNLTQDQLNRTVLAWQTAKVLRSISKGAWEAAKFLSGDLSSPTRVLKEMVDTMVGSDETASGSVRMGGMAALDPNSFKEEAIAQAKSGIKQMLQDEGFPPSVSQGVADGVVTNVVNSIEAGNKGGFNKMLVADIAAQAINGYVQGLNEERMGRIRTLEGELVANSAAIAGASESIMQLRRSIEKANELLANIRTEKAKLEANASECKLERRRACWNAYDAALAEANKQLEAAIKKLDDVENAKNKEVEDAAKAAQTLRDRLKATYEEINNLEKQHGDKLDDYRRAKLELEAAEEYYDRAQQEASDFSRANNITGYTQTYSNLIADFHADRAKWRREVKRLEGEVKPIEDRLDALRKQADEDWPNLAKANDKHEQLEGELDQLREDNKPKREEVAKARDQAANQAQTELDACLKRVSDAASSDATLLFTMARSPNLDRCGKLLAEAEAGYEAVKRNNVKKFIEVPCPKKPKIAIGSPPICPDPAANRAISVGPNSEVGSGARLTEKATGMLGGALGGLLGGGGGGGGGGFGMGPSSMMGGGDEPAQPDTVDDPVSKKLKKKFTHKPSGTKLRVGGKFNDKGLLISTTILDTPGDGTFQTAYLEDPRGHRGGPVGYWIYDVYQEWNLTVSWTHDRWVDGEHVLHEEGGWQESGTNLLDTFRVPVYEEPIWARLGFGSAIKGISSLGTQYLITKEQLKKEPVYLVTHITQPNADPVTTVPMILKLSLNAKGKLDMSQVSATKADNDCKGKKRTKVKQPEPKKSKSKPKAKEPARDPEPSPLDNEFFMGSSAHIPDSDVRCSRINAW